MSPTAVLEVGCGHGTFAARLVEAGIDVIAPAPENGIAVREPVFKTGTRIDVARPFRVSAGAIRDYLRATRFAALADNVPELPHGLTVTPRRWAA